MKHRYLRKFHFAKSKQTAVHTFLGLFCATTDDKFWAGGIFSSFHPRSLSQENVSRRRTQGTVSVHLQYLAKARGEKEARSAKHCRVGGGNLCDSRSITTSHSTESRNTSECRIIPLCSMRSRLFLKSVPPPHKGVPLALWVRPKSGIFFRVFGRFFLPPTFWVPHDPKSAALAVPPPPPPGVQPTPLGRVSAGPPTPEFWNEASCGHLRTHLFSLWLDWIFF